MKNYFYISDINVSDAVSTGNSMGFVDGNTNPALDDYEYDPNGNMVKDRNKGIASITYNYLNLPVRVEWSANEFILYQYNAAGQKLTKTVRDNDSIKIVRYLDGFQYAGDILQFFPTAEGYVKATPVGNANPDSPPTGYAYNYVFNYTDHLGNIRLSYTKDPQSGTLQILEENHYYPFGLRHEIYVTGSKRQHGFGNDSSGGDIDDVELINVLRTDYQYKYNGKEFQDELGLNMYAMDMRQYDPAIARWVVMDPVIHHSVSPYNAFDNNPVFWADPSGAAVDSFLELYEREKNHEHLIQRLLYDKTNEFIMEGGIGFFNGDPTNNYPSPGEEGSPENPIILEPAMLRPPNSFTAVALRAYANSYNGPQFSPYNPDAMSVNIGASGNLYYLNYDVSLSLILSPGNISGGINVGGGLGINSNMPFKNISLFSPYASVGFHDMYGGETNVIDGLRGWSTTTTYSGGPVFLSTSTSSKFYRPNQILPPASYGTKSTYFGYSPRGKNLGVSGFSSYTWIRSLKN